MQKISSFIIWVAICALISACASSQYTAGGDKKEQMDEEKNQIVVAHPQSLADFLVRVPGVYVDDRTYPPTVTIRGGLPLFVIDNVPVGNSYASAANAINVIDIQSVEVLKNPSETMIYGKRGAFGVIVIKTIKYTPKEM